MKSVDRIVRLLSLRHNATPHDIVHDLALNQSTVYCSLRRLQSRGLIFNHVTPLPWPKRHHVTYNLTTQGLTRAKEIA